MQPIKRLPLLRMGSSSVTGASSDPLECVCVVVRAVPVVSQKCNSQELFVRKDQCMISVHRERTFQRQIPVQPYQGHLASGPESNCSVQWQQGETSPWSPAQVQSQLNVSRWENSGLRFPRGLIHSQGCKHYTSPFRFTKLWDLEAVWATCPARYYHVHNIVQNRARVFRHICSRQLFFFLLILLFFTCSRRWGIKKAKNECFD